MKSIKLSIIFLLTSGCLFQLYSCQKNKHEGCYSAKVIHIGKEAAIDPCISDIAVLLTDVEGIPKGTNVSLVSNSSSPLNLTIDRVIYFKLGMRFEWVPGIIKDCTLDPKHLFQIDLCE